MARNIIPCRQCFIQQSATVHHRSIIDPSWIATRHLATNNTVCLLRKQVEYKNRLNSKTALSLPKKMNFEYLIAFFNTHNIESYMSSIKLSLF